MFLMTRAMIEPGVRYLPMVPVPSQPQVTLDAAVDLSKKSDHVSAQCRVTSDQWQIKHEQSENDDDCSDSDTPLDMSVTATTSLTPVFPGFHRPDREVSPARSDRSDILSRLQAGLYSPGSMHRERSTDRSDLDKDEYSRDGCHICGMPRSEMSAHEHGEGVCNQRPIACPLCSKTFTLWSHYETHKKCHQKLKQRQYPCQSCGKIFTSASNRNMHQRIHKGVRPFQCAPCGVYFRQKAHLQKHQRTQGHIQASELYEKRKAEGLVQESDNDKKESGESVNSETRSEDSLNSPASSHDSVRSAASNSESEEFRPSPKRKQSHPQQSLASFEDKLEIALNPRDAQVNLNIEYNTQNHGYDCRQCDFSSHEHSVIKDHVLADHLREKADLQCKECMVTFTKPFNLKIHIRKHETSSQFLPCEYCEQVFKVPNKLIKHMEGVHNVCPTCGDKNTDKAALQDHMEKVHNESKQRGSGGVHSNLQHLSNLTSLFPTRPRADMEERHAKMRKLDSLAEHIRAKQLQNASQTGTNVINGNDKCPPSLIPPEIVINRRKSEMRPDHFPFPRPGLESLVNQLNKIQGQSLKSENNNILSSLSKPLTEYQSSAALRSHEYQTSDHSSPPVSPPHSSPDTAFTKIAPNSSFVLNNNSSISEHSESDNKNGLDLRIKKEDKSDENEVSTTADTADRPDADAFKPRQMIPTSFPYIVPTLPFLTAGRMPPPPSSFTEHLFKLASITRPPVTGLAQDLSKSVAAPHQASVLSAMLGHAAAGAQCRAAAATPPVPSVFPVFPGGIPASMFPQHPLPPPGEERSSSPASIAKSDGPGLESKPFRCSYCPKEFGHLSSLESHVERLHTNEAKHNCEVCGKAYSSKSNLTAHKKIHSGERPFECGVCHKRFRQKAHLQKHETTHSSATPYQCPHCDKAFGHPSNLNTHIATHSDVRPYECGDCGKSYKDSASFKRHRMVHTGERPYNCNICSDTFIDSKSLRRHRELTHPTAVPDPELELEDDAALRSHVMEEEEEEEIEPGQEQQYHLPADKHQDNEQEDRESVDEGLPADESKHIDDDDDIESNEGDLKIAENLTDSGINESMDISTEERTL